MLWSTNPKSVCKFPGKICGPQCSFIQNDTECRHWLKIQDVGENNAIKTKKYALINSIAKLWLSSSIYAAIIVNIGSLIWTANKFPNCWKFYNTDQWFFFGCFMVMCDFCFSMSSHSWSINLDLSCFMGYLQLLVSIGFRIHRFCFFIHEQVVG